jgi:hypothetical protein
MRRTGDGHVLVGDPTGVERLSGVDFDDAVVAHVAAWLVDDTGAGRRQPPWVASQATSSARIRSAIGASSQRVK